MPVDPLRTLDPREIGARLRAARNGRGWTQKQAADALGVARTTMVAIEKGERRVAAAEVAQLARLYGRQLASLLRPGAPVEGLADPLRSAASAGAVSEEELLPHCQRLERLCDDYRELERLAGVTSTRRDPPAYPLEGGDPESTAEDVANAERNRLGLGEAPILDLRDLLEEDLGLRIFYLELPPEVTGMVAFSEEQGGALAIRRNQSPERRRNCLARLYGHLLADRYRAKVVVRRQYDRRPAGERFADSFSRAFLMSAASVRRRFHAQLRRRSSGRPGRATAGDLYHLAHFFFVSPQAMCRRLEELALLPTGTWKHLEKRGLPPESPRRLGLQERSIDDDLLPTRYRHLAIETFQRGDLSEGQLATFLRRDRLATRRLLRELVLEDDQEGTRSLDLLLPLAAHG